MGFKEARQKAHDVWASLVDNKRPLIFAGAASCGRAAGVQSVISAFRTRLAEKGIEASIIEVGCVGMCYLEPIIDIKMPGKPRVSYSNINPARARKLIADHIIGGEVCEDLAIGTVGEQRADGIPGLFEHPMLAAQNRRVLRNCGLIDPTNIDHYIATGGYSGIEKAIEIGPEATIEMVKKSGLRGRGGAGFPTYRKWEFCRRSPGTPKFLICNADEGDPGAFMNRSLLEGDPHAVLEGMLIAGLAIGSSKGIIYARAEYPLAVERLKIALAQMSEYGLLGDGIMGSSFSFEIELEEGAGAFVCGEETALIAALEGRRGMPRPRPPFPAVSGLWGKPTNVNNVETLGNLPQILINGPDWFAELGTEKSKGTKTFALAGKVKRTGLVEVALGTKLRDIVFSIGGGILDEKKFKAVQTGGPSGGCIPLEMLDLPVDYERLAEAGSIMGSGGMVVMDESTCPVDIAHYFISFTQQESCGKCPPCRIGTNKMLGILQKIKSGKGTMRDLALLEELALTVKRASLCGLGQTAPNPVLSTLRYFRDEYIEHIRNRRCPAGVCRKPRKKAADNHNSNSVADATGGE
ncbi:MAG: SLBB domain-containing protein [Candidatus Coatesbacteria bacterium]|nr:SLBB domain-containing protein [Candidatus Coatesbacteria bacterium]